ncbi:MAG: hypothetical protein ACYCSW_05280 [bacterium]
MNEEKKQEEKNIIINNSKSFAYYWRFIKENISIFITLSSILGLGLLLFYFFHIKYVPISLNLIPLGIIAFVQFFIIMCIILLFIFYPTLYIKGYKEVQIDKHKSKFSWIFYNIPLLIIGIIYLLIWVSIIIFIVLMWLRNNPNTYYMAILIFIVLLFTILKTYAEIKLEIKKPIVEDLVFVSIALIILLVFVSRPIFMNILKLEMDSIGLRYENATLYLPYKNFNNFFGYSRYKILKKNKAGESIYIETNYTKIPNVKVLFRGSNHMLIIVKDKNNNKCRRLLIPSNGVKISQNYKSAKCTK